LLHCKGEDGRMLASAWDRLNGETVFMYLLAAGASPDRAIAADCWTALRPFYGTAGGSRFNNADLGLFVFQYGLDLVNLVDWQAPGEVELWAEARLATLANRQVCHDHADRFETYRRFWGLSAGDGPAEGGATHAYRSYSPSQPIDGTAHITASVASVAHAADEVLENVYQAQHDRRRTIRGAYGFSNVNLDRRWIARDMVGIDAGAAALALDNFLMGGRVREVFHAIPCIAAAIERLGFQRRDCTTETVPLASRLAG
ncbi:MAG: glucoamylase family protein, partial [Candidatus Saccharimonadales bacterium]